MSGFVVKATGRNGRVQWLWTCECGTVPASFARLATLPWRDLVPREDAEVFATREAACQAINPMLGDKPYIFLVFSIEAVAAADD
jgi:hypothetical protein